MPELREYLRVHDAILALENLRHPQIPIPVHRMTQRVLARRAAVGVNRITDPERNEPEETDDVGNGELEHERSVVLFVWGHHAGEWGRTEENVDRASRET